MHLNGVTAICFVEVFISVHQFHKSVMVSVATGGGTGESVPMLIRTGWRVNGETEKMAFFHQKDMEYLDVPGS